MARLRHLLDWKLVTVLVVLAFLNIAVDRTVVDPLVFFCEYCEREEGTTKVVFAQKSPIILLPGEEDERATAVCEDEQKGILEAFWRFESLPNPRLVEAEIDAPQGDELVIDLSAPRDIQPPRIPGDPQTTDFTVKAFPTDMDYAAATGGMSVRVLVPHLLAEWTLSPSDGSLSGQIEIADGGAAETWVLETSGDPSHIVEVEHTALQDGPNGIPRANIKARITGFDPEQLGTPQDLHNGECAYQHTVKVRAIRIQRPAPDTVVDKVIPVYLVVDCPS